MNLDPEVGIYYSPVDLRPAQPNIRLSFPISFDEIVIGLQNRLHLSWKIESELRQSLRNDPSITETARQFLLDDDGA